MHSVHFALQRKLASGLRYLFLHLFNLDLSRFAQLSWGFCSHLKQMNNLFRCSCSPSHEHSSIGILFSQSLTLARKHKKWVTEELKDVTVPHKSFTPIVKTPNHKELLWAQCAANTCPVFSFALSSHPNVKRHRSATSLPMTWQTLFSKI